MAGHLLVVVGIAEDGLEDLERVHALRPDLPVARVLLIWIRSVLGKIVGAREVHSVGELGHVLQNDGSRSRIRSSATPAVPA